MFRIFNIGENILIAIMFKYLNNNQDNKYIVYCLYTGIYIYIYKKMSIRTY